MTDDPARWLDEGSDAPEGARELLTHAQPTAHADPRALAASAAALARLNAPVPRSAGSWLAKLAAAPATVVGLMLGSKVAAAATAVAVVALVGVQLVPVLRAGSSGAASSTQPRARAGAPAARPMRATEPAPLPGALPVADPSAAPLASPAAQPQPAVQPHQPAAHPQQRSLPAASPPAARTRQRSPDPVQAAVPVPQAAEQPAAEADPLALEVHWLDQARGLLATAPAAALARANAHAQRFASPALAAERELIAIDALLRLGRRAEARARADAFGSNYPGSLYRARLASLLRRSAP